MEITLVLSYKMPFNAKHAPVGRPTSNGEIFQIMELIHQIIYNELSAHVAKLGSYNFVGSIKEFVLKDTYKAVTIHFKNKYAQIQFFFAEYGATSELRNKFDVALFNDRYILVDLDKFSEIKYGKESLRWFSLNAYTGNKEERVKSAAAFFFKLLSHPELQPIYIGQFVEINDYLKSVWEHTGK